MSATEAPRQWDLNDTQHWDVLTALRGCDCPSELLKSVTTCPIRYLAGYRGQSASWLTPEAAKDVWEAAAADQREVARRLWRENDHFRAHVCLAFDVFRAWRTPGVEEYWAWMIERLRTPR